MFPTSRPSGSPSSMPTLTLETRWGDKLEAAALNLTDDSKVQESYYEVKVADQIAVYGGCAAWQRYTGGDLSYNSIFQVPSALRIAVNSDFFDNTVNQVSCSSTTVAGQILEKIMFPLSDGVTSTFTCYGHTWRVKDCTNSGQASFCVDCVDPCNRDFCTPTDPFYIGPCNAAGSSCAFPAASLRIFTVEFLDAREVFPTIESSVVIRGRTANNLKLALSGAGTMSCGVFALGQRPTSAAQILVQKYTANAVNDAVSFNFTGLVPASKYDVYCYSSSESGAAMSLADILGTKISMETDCCRTVALAIGVRFVFQGEQSVNSVTLTSDSLIPGGLSIALFATINGVTTSLQPAIVTLRNVLSTTASIVAANTATTGTVTISATVLNSTIYGVSFQSSRQTFAVVTRTQIPPAPSVQSAVFSSFGSSIEVTFDSPTDQAGAKSSAAFDCSSLLTITDTSPPRCQWRSNAALVVTPAPNSLLVPATSQFLFLGGKVKAPCTLSVTACNAWPFSDARVLSLAAPVDPVIPTGTCFVCRFLSCNFLLCFLFHFTIFKF